MRALGYRVVDLIVRHFEGLSAGDVGKRGTPEALESALREAVPRSPGDPMAVLERLEREIAPNMLHVDHPRFFAFVPSPSNFVSAMADALAGGLNFFCGTWFAGSGPAEVELVTLEWLRQICGLPEGAGGIFVSGGSIANLTAMAVARHSLLGEDVNGAVIYTSNQTHSSVIRSLKILGFGADQVRQLECDAGFRLDVVQLTNAIEEDKAAGRRPFCIIANAGTTNTGAVDPLGDLARIARAHGMWLHVDGAYGAPAVLTGRGAAVLTGLDEADSLALDPHKWLFQSFEAGCVLVRDRRLLLETFQVMPEYLRDTARGGDEINFGNYGIQLTRSFRALKLWMSLQTFGLDAFAAAIERGIDLAELAERTLRAEPDWEVVTAACLGVVTFRFAPPGMDDAAIDALQGRMVEAMMEEGYAIATSTVLRGRPALRLCTINPRTSDEEMVETVNRLARIGRSLAAGIR
jgi:glutamate/tyrosine decarboxylase-like PLP-dependent enzyme